MHIIGRPIMKKCKLAQGLLFSILVVSPLSFAALSSTPTAWSNFAPTAYTINGAPMRDAESSSDPSQGSASVTPSRSDIASGFDGTNGSAANCNPTLGPSYTDCGPETSIFWAWYDGGTVWDGIANSASMNDDYLFFRMRINGDPATNGIGLNSTHWNFLIDTDRDGYKEFWIDVDGSFQGGPSKADQINIYYDDTNTQEVLNITDAPAGSRVNVYTACSTMTGCPNSHTRTFPVTDLDPSDTTGEFYLEVQVPVTAFDDTAGNQIIFPDSELQHIFSTSASNSDPLQKDFVPNCVDALTVCEFGDTTPVTMAFADSQTHEEGTLFEWVTQTETGNLGFEIQIHTGRGWETIDTGLIPSASIDSMEPNEYAFFAEGLFVDRYRLVDVAVDMKKRYHGPFKTGQAYGKRYEAEAIDWDPANQQRQVAEVDRSERHGAENRRQGITAAELMVSEDGLYRVSYASLAAAGVLVDDIDPRHLALTAGGEAVPIYLVTSNERGRDVFGPGSYFEFWGTALDTLYTKTNVYQLRLNEPRATRIQVDRSPVPRNGTGPTTYRHTEQFEENNAYNFAASIDDPWYMASLLTLQTSKSFDFPLAVDHIENGEQVLNLSYWGVTDYNQPIDHRVRISLNGEFLHEDSWDGRRFREQALTLPANLLQEGNNTLTLTLTGDTGAMADLIYLEKYSVSYARALVSRDGEFHFDGIGKRIAVDGFDAGPVNVYKQDGTHLIRIENVAVSRSNNGYSATFGGSNQSARYHLVSDAAVREPQIRTSRPAADLFGSRAEYLIISHGLFKDHLDDLITARQADGYQVKVVDVADLYDHYTHGVFDPEAIRAYLRDAATELGLRFVLLVGGDTYDYHHYAFPEAFSFVPTMYGRTHNLVAFAPLDALFTDLDGDYIPDVPIGRLPVRTLDELQNVIDKILTYQNTVSYQSAVFVADQDEANTSFRVMSDKSAAVMPPNWQQTKAYVDDLGLSNAKQTLVDAINDGVGLANFYGHSGPTSLGVSGLFGTAEVGNLQNVGAPTIFAQWGCWNAYFVYPRYTTLGHRLMLNQGGGAATVIGAAALTDVGSANLMGHDALSRMTQPGATIGEALLAAKRALAEKDPHRLDIILGMMILGDPALKLQP